MKLYEESGLKNLYIKPAMTDSGAGLGALILSLKKKKRLTSILLKNLNLKCLIGDLIIIMMKLKKHLKNLKIRLKLGCYKFLWHEDFAKLITEGKIGGLFQGEWNLTKSS